MTATARPERAVARLAVRETRTGVAVLAATSILMMSAMVQSFDRTDVGASSGFSDLLENPAVRALYGMPFDVTNAGGFAVWRAGTFLCIFTGLWGLLTATRVLRGEEEAGRWDLLLTAPITRRGVLGTHGEILAGGSLVIGAGVLVAFVANGQPVAGSALYALGVTLLTLTFVGVGAVTSQLFAARRRAAAVAGAVLGVSYVVRMIADSIDDAAWLRWLSPLGWVENLQAFAGDRALPLVPLTLAPIVLFVVAFELDGRRDTDDGVFRDPGTARSKLTLLRDPLTFAWRQRLSGVVVWGASLFGFGFVLGAITDAFVDFIAGDAQIADLTQQFGYTSLSDPQGFVSSMIAMCAAVVAVYAVTGIHRMWEDEQFDRLDLVFAASVSRTRWLAAAAAASAVGAVLALLLTGVGTWVGCVVTGVDLTFAEALGSAANLVALVALFFGAAIALHGLAPKLTMPVAGGGAAGLYVWSFLAPAVDAPQWAIDLSPWAHVAVAPPDPVNWTSTVAMVVIGVALTAVGFVAYARRDLREP